MTDHDVAVEMPSEETSEERPDRSLAEQLVAQARADGKNLLGPGGLLSDLTKQVLDTGLEVEMEEHVGYAKHASEGRKGGNSRNGTRSKTVITDVGPVELDVPRDRDVAPPEGSELRPPRSGNRGEAEGQAAGGIEPGGGGDRGARIFFVIASRFAVRELRGRASEATLASTQPHRCACPSAAPSTPCWFLIPASCLPLRRSRACQRSTSVTERRVTGIRASASSDLIDRTRLR